MRWPGLIGLVGFDFIPKDDQSEYEVAITTPEGWNLQRVDRTFREIEGRIRELPGVVNIMATIGETSGRVSRGQGDVTRGGIYIRLKDLAERDFSQFAVMGQTRRILADYPDLRTSVQLPAAISAGQVNADVEFNLVGPELDKLLAISESMLQKLRANPGLTDVDTTLALRKPELRVEVNRERASDLGVSIETVAATLRTLVGGQIVSDFRDNSVGELYDVWLRAHGVDRSDPAAVQALAIPSSKCGLIELQSIARLTEARGPSQIDRFARQRKVSLVGNLSGLATNQAQDAFYQAFADASRELKAGAGYNVIATGRAKSQNQSNAAFLMALIFSLIFMYMILAAQFESFVHPITILLAVPITVPFALLSLILLGQAMSRTASCRWTTPTSCAIALRAIPRSFQRSIARGIPAPGSAAGWRASRRRSARASGPLWKPTARACVRSS
jgi:HAE1 family hydrophobic/amphiphilic exporter-1